MNRLGLQGDGALQSFQEGEIFGDVVVLAADPFGYSDLAALRIVDETPMPADPGFTRDPPST